MIVVRVELWSAVSRTRDRELARIIIDNDGVRSVGDPRRGTYRARSFRGRSTEQLNRQIVEKETLVENWPRGAVHIWNLVRLVLERMGYTKGVAA
jgi:ribosome-binding protein aMBF1 (putative translation factor)